MKDSRLARLADLMINYSLELKAGEYLLLTGGSVTAPLLKELYHAALKVGAHPEVRVELEGLSEILFKAANQDQLTFVSPVSKVMAEKYDAMVGLWGDMNTRSLSSVDPQKMAARFRAAKELVAIRNEREAKGEFRWVGTLFPTQANAQDANMSLDEYEGFVYGAGLLDKADPVTEWTRISKEQQKAVDYLNTKKELNIISKDTDLKMSIAGRPWVNCDGHINFPDGEVFTSPVEDTVEGHIRFSYPGIFNGVEIEDIRLEFKEGKVVKAEAGKGKDLLIALLDTDEGSRRLGEIAIGTNYQIDTFTRHMLFDEKMGGTVHAALGKAYPNAGGTNMSSIHWDMLCDMKEGGRVYADGELFYKDGKFLEDVIGR